MLLLHDACRTMRVGLERHLFCIEDPFKLTCIPRRDDTGSTMHVSLLAGQRGCAQSASCIIKKLLQLTFVHGRGVKASPAQLDCVQYLPCRTKRVGLERHLFCIEVQS
jgi:hypothetical protein